MTTQALYNKWRGQSFGDILGQEHITTTLRNQIRTGRIGHAYLFTGLRGTGKTSTARILAKAVNCLGETDDPPCNQCRVCQNVSQGRSVDLVEIDGASNRGIDEIRELRDRVAFAPSESRYKVYVIDEVHMLTNEAFNALLKTLEEPPPHVIFVLCTTEPHRLPATVLSRCQRFDFRRGAVAVVVQKLGTICAQEHIQISVDALDYIARRATGSFRDAESLLDQLAAYGQEEITLDLVQRVLGSVSSVLIVQLIVSITNGDAPTGLRVIRQAFDEGAEPRQFLSEILDHLRALMLLWVGGTDDLHTLADETLEQLRQVPSDGTFSLTRLVTAIKVFTQAGQSLRMAVRPELPIELAFLESMLQDGDAAPVLAGAAAVESARPGRVPVRVEGGGDANRTIERVRQIPQAAEAAVVTEPETSTAISEPVVPEPERERARAQAQPVAPPAEPKERVQAGADQPVQGDSPQGAAKPEGESLRLEWVQGNWPQVLTRVKPRSPQVQALLNSAYPVGVQGDTVLLNCEARFHRDTLSEESRRSLVEEALSEVLGRACRVECVIDSPARETSARVPQAGPGGDLFSASEDAEGLRRKLRNHPTVKMLEDLGGRVTNVQLTGEGETKESHGE
ncbi:MAG: DNA polymerase III subunit gamma/tau [Anaerolineae bacterium]